MNDSDILKWMLGLFGSGSIVGFSFWLSSLHRQIRELQIAIAKRSERIATVEESLRNIQKDVSEIKAMLPNALAGQAKISLEIEKLKSIR